MTMVSGNCFLMRRYCWRRGVITRNNSAIWSAGQVDNTPHGQRAVRQRSLDRDTDPVTQMPGDGLRPQSLERRAPEAV